MSEAETEWRRAGRFRLGAAAYYDAPGSPLPAAARRARWGGFASGAEWMAEALSLVRGRAIPPLPSGLAHRLGWTKYGLAALGALPGLALAFALHWSFLALAILGFCVIGSRLAFAFPLALEGAARPLRASWAWTRPLSWPDLTIAILRIAASMLTGGLLGRGFLRSWCLGGLAVLLRYAYDERER